MNDVLFFIGRKVMRFLFAVGQVCILFLKVLWCCRLIPGNINRITREMVIIGVNAVSIASVMAFFTGMVLALQSAFQLDIYGLKDLLGTIVGLSMIKELGPVFISLLVAGRAGSAMAAEIGSMAISEELLALRSMAIDPVRFLVMPKFVAACIMVPVLVIFSLLFGFMGGALISSVSVGLDYETFFEGIYKVATWKDYLGSMIKSLGFGAIIALVSCHHGLETQGGAEQLGAATTNAVVSSFISIFIMDYFITKILMIVF